MSYIEWTPLQYTTFKYNDTTNVNKAKAYIIDFFSKVAQAGLTLEAMGKTDAEINSYVFNVTADSTGSTEFEIGSRIFSTPIGTGETTFSEPDANGHVKIVSGTYPKSKLYVKFTYGFYNTGYYNASLSSMQSAAYYDLYINVSVYFNESTILKFDTFRHNYVSAQAGAALYFGTSEQTINNFKAFINMNHDGLYINLSPILLNGTNGAYVNCYSINKLNFGVDIYDDFASIYINQSPKVNAVPGTSYFNNTNVFKYHFVQAVIHTNNYNEVYTNNNNVISRIAGYYFINKDLVPIKNGIPSYVHLYNISGQSNVYAFKNILATTDSMPTGIPIDVVCDYKNKKVIRTFMCSERDVSSPAAWGSIDTAVCNTYMYNVDKISMV